MTPRPLWCARPETRPDARMPQTLLARLAHEKPLRVLLVDAGEPDTLTWSGLYQPLRLAAKIVGPERLHVDVRSPDKFVAGDQSHWHLVLLVADEAQAGLKPANCRTLIERCRAAPVWGGVGAGVLWLADSGVLNGVRTALPWALYVDVDSIADHAIFTPHLYEFDQHRLTCCGGAAAGTYRLRKVVTDIGYDSGAKGFDGNSCAVMVTLGAQSRDIAREERIAGDNDRLGHDRPGGSAAAQHPESLRSPSRALR